MRRGYWEKNGGEIGFIIERFPREFWLYRRFFPRQITKYSGEFRYSRYGIDDRPPSYSVVKAVLIYYDFPQSPYRVTHPNWDWG
jgi:hypothetical protein